MANQIDANEVIKQGNTRSFYQPGGAGTELYFFGLDTEYHFIESGSLPTNGSIDPIFAPDPRRPNRYKLIGRQIAAPTLPEISVSFAEKWGGIPRPLTAPKCKFNMYEVHSRCADFSDLYRGWDSYMMVYSGFQFTDTIDLGARTAMNSDELLTNTVSATGSAIYPVGSLSFGEEAATEVVVAVVDVVFGTNIQCIDCGTPNDGSQFQYALTRANVGSPSAPGQLVYSLDGGSTWNTAIITGLNNTHEPKFIDIAGNVLFIGAGNDIFYTVLDQDTGAPTTWSTLVAGATLLDVYVQSPNNIWYVSASGVYKTGDVSIAPTLISNTPSTTARISGYETTIVATGASGMVWYSKNNGVTWVQATIPASTTLNAVAVASEKKWYVGGANGNVYITTDRGNSWSVVATPNSGSGSVTDIQIATDEIIWIAQNINSVAYLITTLDGGNSWTINTSGTVRILNWPTFQSINRLAVPYMADPFVAANYLLIGGLATGGTDGILLSAGPTIL